MKTLQLAFLAALMAVGIANFAFPAAADPLTGTWTGDWGPSAMDRNQVTVELKWDGKDLTGTINPGPSAVELKKATFNPATGAVHFEADVTGRRGNPIHYMVDGKLEMGTMTGTWNHDNRKGDFKVTKK